MDQPSSLPSRSTRRFSLLLAEDNLPDSLLVMEAIRMQDLPFDVELVADGQEAIDFIRHAEEALETPPLRGMVLDLNLPKRDGFEVLRVLRDTSKFKDIPVLIVTSSDSPADLNQAAALGAGYFHKPPNYDEFLKLGGVLKQMLGDTSAM